MGKSYLKSIARTFRSTKSRFLSVFGIVALGVGFLAGLSGTPVDMKRSVERYLDDGNFYDVRVLSTLGLTDADVEALGRVPGVRQVEPGWSADLLVKAGETDAVVSRVHSVSGEQSINRLVLQDGRMPQSPGECVVEAGANATNPTWPIGTTIKATDDNEDLDEKLAVTEFTVVGIVRNSNYFSFEREPASVGDGTIRLIFYIPPKAFAYEAYTEIYLTAEGALELDSLEQDYQTTVDALTASVEAIAEERCQARYNSLKAEGQQEIDDAWAEYNDAKAEAEQELADAWAELEDGRRKLADGEKKVKEGEADYQKGLRELNDNLQKLNDGIAALGDAENQLNEAENALTEGWEQLREGGDRLDSARRQLEAAQAQYDEGKSQLEKARQQLAEGKEQFDQLEQLDDGYRQYQGGLGSIASAINGMLGISEEEAQDQGVTGQDIHQVVAELSAIMPEQIPGDNTELVWLTLERVLLQSPALTPTRVAVSAMQVHARELYEALSQLPSEEQPAELMEWLAEFYAQEPDEILTEASRIGLNLCQILQSNPLSEAARELVDASFRILFGYSATEMTDAVRNLVIFYREIDAGMAQLAEQKGLESKEQAYEQISGITEATRKSIDDGEAQFAAGEQQLADAKAQLEDGWRQYNEGMAQLAEGRTQLEESRRQLDDGWALLAEKKVQLADAQRQLTEGRQKLADARVELDDARVTLAENLQKLRDGELDYEDALREVNEELADARAEIEDGEAELAKLEFPEWYVWDRSHNVSWASFKTNVDKLQAITTIFPVFFFLVAALVVSTTMTRMIEEERLQIGTLKALGYRSGEIMVKYLLYALAAALLGTAVGLTVGFYAFPTVIWSAYTIMYYVPVLYTPWQLNKALFAGGTLTGLTVGVTALACRASLSEAPAALMLPRAPRAGQRILLERITPLWRRLPFTWKVTCRNLFRYKKRFWMTVIGVSGCTALLVTGFGISDSLDAICTNQYGNIYHYDLTTAIAHPEDTASGPAHDYLYGADFDRSLAASMEKTTQPKAGTAGLECYLMVPQDLSAFADFADLHERLSGKATPLGEQGVVVTEKFAKEMGVSAGDTLTLENSEGTSAEFTVSGVCEHYVFNYVYLSAAAYEEGFGTPASWNVILTRFREDGPAQGDISRTLLAMDAVSAVNFTTDQMTTVLNMLDSIDAVVVLIIVCAAALAFVVLYNLSNINIAERVKEIATLKVLGFHDKETYRYVSRESSALTLIGALAGLVLGIWLHRFIITTVEVDAVMFGRQIQPLSFVYALVLTLLFGTVVNRVMGLRLKKISMVESMKAPE